MKYRSTFLVGVGFLVTVIFAVAAHANHNSLDFAEGPEGAWAYSARPSGTTSTTFFATDTSQFAGAVFQGFVVPHEGVFAFDPTETTAGKFHIFTTFVLFAEDMEVNLGLTSDDGLSVFLDGEFIIGKPFGGRLLVTLLFEGGRETKFEIVGHNGVGPSGFALGDFADNNRSFEELFPGVQIHAEGDFADQDDDGIRDSIDNCPDTPNPSQDDAALPDLQRARNDITSLRNQDGALIRRRNRLQKSLGVIGLPIPHGAEVLHIRDHGYVRNRQLSVVVSGVREVRKPALRR